MRTEKYSSFVQTNTDLKKIYLKATFFFSNHHIKRLYQSYLQHFFIEIAKITLKNFVAANLKLNPNKDWGFRIGNWYIIRRHELGEETYSTKNIDDWSDWKEFINAKTGNTNNSDKKADNDFYSGQVLSVSEPSTKKNDNNNGYEDLSAEVMKPEK